MDRRRRRQSNRARDSSLTRIVRRPVFGPSVPRSGVPIDAGWRTQAAIVVYRQRSDAAARIVGRVDKLPRRIDGDVRRIRSFGGLNVELRKVARRGVESKRGDGATGASLIIPNVVAAIQIPAHRIERDERWIVSSGNDAIQRQSPCGGIHGININSLAAGGVAASDDPSGRALLGLIAIRRVYETGSWTSADDSIRFSWPHAAKISRPRGLRTKQGTARRTIA